MALLRFLDEIQCSCLLSSFLVGKYHLKVGMHMPNHYKVYTVKLQVPICDKNKLKELRLLPFSEENKTLLFAQPEIKA